MLFLLFKEDKKILPGDEFSRGETSGRKCNPANVAEDMKRMVQVDSSGGKSFLLINGLVLQK